MEKQIWKAASLTKKLPCPYCSIGLLKPINGSFKSIKTKETLELEIEFRGQYPWTDFYFAGILKCNDCGDIVTTCGSWTEDRQGVDITEDPQTGELKLSEPEKYFYPKYFYPNLKIFKIPGQTPDKVKDCLNQSFALYWGDVSSSINKVRTAVEYIMDSQGIPRFEIKFTVKKNRKPHRREKRLTLHQRINRFKTKKSELGDYIFNLKELGNVASHTNNLNDTDLLLNIYETLEFVLINMYNKPDKID
ncbi:hypothetical protein ES705_23543 [subsurface metagenome]